MSTKDKDSSPNPFREAMSDIVPISQDKHAPYRSKPDSGARRVTSNIRSTQKQLAADFHFSDGFEAHFDINGPLRYVKDPEFSHEIKRLRRGDYPPDIILDLHGMKREQAKNEIAALIFTAIKEHAHCVCIVHGIGGHVLKRAVPNWLVQHPDIAGFHQAPLEWGGQGALLVLLKQQR